MGFDTAKDEVIRHRVLRSTASNFIGKLITLGAGFLLTPFILNQLGQGHYGMWVLVGSTVAYSSLLDLGIAGAVIKYVAEYRARGENEQAQTLIATAMRLYCFIGLIAVVLSAILAPIVLDLFNVLPHERATAATLVLLSGITVGISIPCSLTVAILRGLQRFDLINFISSVGTLISLGAVVAALLMGGGIVSMVAVNVPVILAMQLVSVYLIKRAAPELRLGWRGAKRSLVRPILSFSSSLFVIDIATRLQTKTDEMVIGVFLPVSSITPYSLARRLSEVAQILTDQFMKVILPLASELHAENDRARLRSLYITSTRLTIAIFLPVGCVLVVFAKPILSAWVGADYAQYSYLVTILTLASLIVTSQWPAGSILQGIARHRPLAVMAICSGLANLVLSIALIYPLGLTGVALGTLIPTSIECIGFVLPYALRVIDVRATEALKEIVLPALLPAVPMAIILYVTQTLLEPRSLLSIMVVAGIGVLVYAIGYLSVGACESERATCRSFALSTIRFAEACLKRI
jgi:O-antigen/teichoic acid export membrane protein